MPYAKDFFIDNVKVTNAQKAFEVGGLPQSIISNFNFTNSVISAGVLGTMEFAEGFKFNNTTIDISTKAEEKKKGGIEEKERLQ